MASKKEMPGYGKIELKTVRGKDGAAIRAIVERAHAKPDGKLVTTTPLRRTPAHALTDEVRSAFE